ncbi:MAG: DnaD domain protein [Clostridiales bacterium]|nr:DnaD domain protein [Clostridiales bacterium]
MKFDKGKTKDYYLFTTDVENVFINEYMTEAPGEYVKAYLYGLFCSEHGMELKSALMAEVLHMDEDRLREAWEYWERMNVVAIEEEDDDYTVVFLSLREQLFSGEQGVERAIDMSDEVMDEDEEFKRLTEAAEDMLGRPLNGRELQEIDSWTKELGVPGEVIHEAFDYCVEIGKPSINYISKVILAWAKEGLTDREMVKEYLEKTSERQGIYRRILNSLGLKRNVTEAEKRLVDSWLDDMKFSPERILEACEKAGFTQSPNLRYVNKVLENWKQEADTWGRDVNQRVNVSQNTLNKYYEYLRNQAEKRAEGRRQEVYNKLPEIRQIDINLQSLSSKISRGLLGGSTVQDMNSVRQEIRNLEKERAILLTENNYALDYTDVKYLCPKCSDTGIDENGQRCSCTRERMGEAELWQNGKL